jgi:hypothetical protein
MRMPYPLHRARTPGPRPGPSSIRMPRGWGTWAAVTLACVRARERSALAPTDDDGEGVGVHVTPIRLVGGRLPIRTVTPFPRLVRSMSDLASCVGRDLHRRRSGASHNSTRVNRATRLRSRRAPREGRVSAPRSARRSRGGSGPARESPRVLGDRPSSTPRPWRPLLASAALVSPRPGAGGRAPH